MNTATQTAKPEIKLSCREAHLILRVIRLEKNVKDMKKEEVDVIRHYLYCKNCRDKGLAGILEKKLPCQQAILVWAENACAMWLSCMPGFLVQTETLKEILAIEHVWGKYQWKNDAGGHDWDNFTSCSEPSCRKLLKYWDNVPMSTSAGDGPMGVINLFPFLTKMFLEEGLPLKELLAIQEKRIVSVLSDLKNGVVTVSSGHYHFKEELVAEIEEHFRSLRWLANRHY